MHPPIPRSLEVKDGGLPFGLRPVTNVAPSALQSCAPPPEGGKGRTSSSVSVDCPDQSSLVLWALRLTVNWCSVFLGTEAVDLGWEEA